MEQCIICGTLLRENETVCPQCGFAMGLSFLSEKQYENWLREAVEPYRREYGQKRDRLLAEQQQKHQQECEKKLPEEATPVKRKKKWLIPIAGVLAAVVAVGGITVAMNQQGKTTEKTAALQQNNDTTEETSGAICWELSEDGKTLTFSGTGSISSDLVDTIAMDKVDTIIIEEGISEIGFSAFYHCESLKSITLPDSLQSIGNSAFNGCSSLESISCPIAWRA